MKCLVKTTGWIGDSFFCLPLAEKLKKQYNFDEVDYLIYIAQPHDLIKRNKYINNVFLGECDESKYDKIFTMPVIEENIIPPTVKFQEFCGIENTSSEYYIDTDPQKDILAECFLNTLPKKPFIAIHGNWNERRWNYSEDQFQKGIINNQGEVESIIKGLDESNKFNLINIFHDFKHSRIKDIRGYDASTDRYSLMASIIKKCDLFIGAEGGLSNLAAGLGVKCIITTCHMFRDMKIKNQSEPKLGPKNLFPNKDHIHMSPFSTNEDFIKTLLNNF
jgi:hypothetical protein